MAQRTKTKPPRGFGVMERRSYQIAMKIFFTFAAAACFAALSQGFSPSHVAIGRQAVGSTVDRNHDVTALSMSDDFIQESAEDTKERIQALVENHPVLLFMKGSKLFPQCGFSNSATQILMSYNIDFHTVDVLSDEAIRQGIKDYSQWPTIPQLYVAGEFIGGSDIMIEMYQNGELGEMIEKAKAEMM